jgi:HD-GYP domain-containing protein (c-di-GMP phosphodiesterase class II)
MVATSTEVRPRGVRFRGNRTRQPDQLRWSAHPIAAGALTLSAFVVPLVSCYFGTRLAASLLVNLPLVSRVPALASVAIAIALVTERVMHRVLPLSVLVRMSMVFPDHSPSRLALARSCGGTQVLEELARAHSGEALGDSATRILGLVAALGAHDRLTSGHSERVRMFADVIARELYLSTADRDKLRWAALLHDIGKLNVPTGVLNKPGKLDDAEWATMRLHPAQGAILAEPLVEWLGDWAGGIGQHHERFDGLGYPLGLAGDKICLAARIVAVADVFEVMTAARSYKRPVSVAAARRELAKIAGTQLDPECVRAFLGASLPRVLWTVGPVAILANLPWLRTVVDAGHRVQLVAHTTAAHATQAATVAVVATVAVASTVGLAASGAAQNVRPTATTHRSQTGVPTGPVSASAATTSPTPTSTATADPTLVPAAAIAVESPLVLANAVVAAAVLVPARSRPVTAAIRSGQVAPATAVATPAASPGGSGSPTSAPTSATATPAPPASVSLGAATSFGILAGSTITSTGPTVVAGLVGLSPGTAVTGLTSWLIDGSVGPSVAAAQAALAAAAGAVAAMPVTATLPVELGGTTVRPGVYTSGTFGITGTVTLDAGGDPNAVFVFRAASTLITASGSQVVLVGGAQAANVFWSVGSSATLGTNSGLKGNVLASASITVTTGATVTGRLLARTGAVTLDSATISQP